MDVSMTRTHTLRRVLEWLTTPGVPIDAPDERRTARLVMQLLLALTGVGLLGGVIPLLLPVYDEANRLEGLTYFLASLPFLLMVYWLARTGHHLWALRLSVFGLIGGIGLFSLPYEDPTNLGYLFYLIIPVLLASAFLSTRAVVCALIAALLVGYAVLGTTDTLLPGQFGYFDLTSVLLAPGLLIILGKVHRERVEADRRRALFQREMTFNLVSQNASDAILLFDPKGTILSVNPAFTEISGLKPEDYIGMSLFTNSTWHQYIGNGSAQELLGKLEEAKHSRTPVHSMVQLHRPDGSMRWVDVVFNSIIREDGAIVGVICIGRDVTERMQMTQTQMDQERLSVELRKERELSDLKSLFMTTVSHEFRTPLATILSSIEMLDRYSDRMTPERRAEGLGTIREQVERLRSMLADMTLLIQVQTSGIFQAETLNLRTFMEELLAEFRQHIAPDHVFNGKYEGQFDAIGADRRLLRNILSNLLGNAAKYSAPGTSIDISVSRAGDQVIFSVRDQGRGIRKSDRERMFDAFYRGENVGETSGTGLGLKIVQDSIALYKGTIEVESTEGIGTTVTVSLPVLIV